MHRLRQGMRRVATAAKHPGGFKKLGRSLALDLRYGGRLLGGTVQNAEEGKGFHRFENTDYAILDRIFEDVELLPNDLVVDVGCGRGRLMNWLLRKGFRGRIVGVEVNPPVAEFARSRLKQYSQIEIVTGDATQILPPDGSVFYLYNPFEGPLIRAFAEKLASMPVVVHRRQLIIYFNPAFLGEFEKLGLWRVRLGTTEPHSHLKVAYLERLQHPHASSPAETGR
jgi:SAM-dependent methyltransferase